jgi:hypothetical protein
VRLPASLQLEDAKRKQLCEASYEIASTQLPAKMRVEDAKERSLRDFLQICKLNM